MPLVPIFSAAAMAIPFAVFAFNATDEILNEVKGESEGLHLRA